LLLLAVLIWIFNVDFDPALRLAEAEAGQRVSRGSLDHETFEYILSRCQQAYPSSSRREIAKAILYYNQNHNRLFPGFEHTVGQSSTVFMNPSPQRLSVLEAAKNMIATEKDAGFWSAIPLPYEDEYLNAKWLMLSRNPKRSLLWRHYFLERKLDPNSRRNQNSPSLVEIAIRNDKLEDLRFLVQQGGEVKGLLYDKVFITTPRVIEYLLEQGEPVNGLHGDRTPLLEAVEWEQFECAEVLTRWGGKVPAHYRQRMLEYAPYAVPFVDRADAWAPLSEIERLRSAAPGLIIGP
jgi:hypothetical protein